MKLPDIPRDWKITENAVFKPLCRINKDGSIWNGFQKSPIVSCPFCKTRFAKTDPRNIYCSIKCRSTYGRGALTHTWNGGRIINRGYVLIYMPGHPLAKHGRDHAYAQEHRVVMSNHIGRIIDK